MTTVAQRTLIQLLEGRRGHNSFGLLYIINLIARGKTSAESAASSQSTDSMIASQAASQVSGNIQKLAGISNLTIDPTLGGNNQNPSARVAIAATRHEELSIHLLDGRFAARERDRSRELSDQQALVGQCCTRSVRRRLDRRPVPHEVLTWDRGLSSSDKTSTRFRNRPIFLGANDKYLHL